MINTSVAFFIFNRPNITKQVFEAIRQAQPSKLFIIADGPREDHPEDIEKCASTRQLLEKIDWDCQIIQNYSDINLGCKQRISSGIDWVFEQVEEAIILEEDCLPHPSFFQFCEELLEKHRHDQRIMTISGNNFQFGRKRHDCSYYFSRYALIWGWATWRRAWQSYDVEMKDWLLFRDGNWLEDVLDNSQAIQYWSKLFQGCYEGNIDSWSLPWNLASWMQNGLCILPNVNLVSNIGFSPNAMTTKDIYSPFANHPTTAMEFPLKHPPFMIRDAKADQFTQQSQFSLDLISKVKSKAKKILNTLNL
jgi:hypothetical protein